MGKNWEGKGRDRDRYEDRGRDRPFFKKGPTKRELILEEMKQKMKAAYLQRDALLIYVEGMIEDLEKVTNLIFERENEWYSLYFPELKILDRTKYCKLVLAIDKEDPKGTEERVRELAGDKANDVLRQLSTSTGIEMLGKDLERIREGAQKIIELSKYKEDLERYEEGVAKEVCPNLAEVGGPKIAAKLIAHVGGLQKLAKLPASTIQVLGAEKALFKHMKKHTKPPKHGLIFQHNAVHSAPKSVRGKIARAIATKLAMAVKVDAYSKRFIGKEMKEKLDAKIKDILAKESAKSHAPAQ